MRDTDAFTIVEYVKSSIEILMNMKMEEAEIKDKAKNLHSISQASLAVTDGGMDLSEQFEI